MNFKAMRNSLAGKLLANVFKFYLIIAVLVTLLHMVAEFSFTQDDVKVDLSVFHGTFEPGLAIAIWNQEDLGLKASLDAMIQVPQITGAKVENDEGEIIGAIGTIMNHNGEVESIDKHGQRILLADKANFMGLFWESKPIIYRDVKEYSVGQLTLYSNSAFVFGRVQHGYVFIIINAIVKTIALWVIVLWLSKPFLSRPLAKISEAIKNRNMENLDPFYFNHKYAKSEELRNLESAFNIMLKTLKQSFKESKNAEIKLDTYAKSLERSNKEISSFASITSHDLKSPIRKISNFCGRIEEEDPNLSDHAKKFLSKIQLTANHASDLVDGILEYSKLTNDETTHEPVDLNETLSKVIEYLELDLEEKNGKVKVGNLPRIKGNKVQMEQLFENLISNSLKYRRSNVPPIIEISHSEINGNLWEIIVKDNGVGFENRYAEQIFDPFKRLDGNVYNLGSGLGLSICKKIMLAHNGSIFAEGEVGKGSIITMFFPQEK